MPPRRSTVNAKQKLTPKQIEEQKRRIRQTQACLRVQRILRGIQIRNAFRRVKEIEDILFALREQPIVVFQEFLAMANTASDPSLEEEDCKLLEASPPDFGLIIPELDTDEEREERERVQAEYDAKLEEAKALAEEKRLEREELDQADVVLAAEERISTRTIARELRRRGYQGDANKAVQGLFRVIHPKDRIPEGFILGDFAQMRAHKLRRIIANGATMQLQLILVRHGEADFMADKLVAERQRPLTEQGILQAVTAGQNFAIANCKPDIILSSTSQRCLETVQWIQELAPREWLFSTCKALDQKEDPTGRLGPSIFPIADTIISYAEARPDIFTVCLLSHGMLLETIASCLTFQSDNVRESGVKRILCGDVVILQSKPLNVAEGEDLDERPAADLWTEAMRSERWSVLDHLRGDGEPDPPTPRPVDDSTKNWYKHSTDMSWVASAGGPLIYTEESLVYQNYYSGTKLPQASTIAPSLRLLVAGWVSPSQRTPREDEEPEDFGEDGDVTWPRGRRQTLSQDEAEGDETPRTVHRDRKQSGFSSKKTSMEDHSSVQSSGAPE
jgi:phosphohistidine phosphatase SixA